MDRGIPLDSRGSGPTEFVPRRARLHDLLRSTGEETPSQRRLLARVSICFVLAGLVWSAAYFLLGVPLAGSIPFAYGVTSLVSLFIFQRTGNYAAFRTSQLLLILLLPFLLMIVLGGFVNSSAVILWSLVCPMGALVFSTPRAAIRWFLAFALLVTVSGALQPLLRAEQSLPASTVVIFFVLNIVTVSAIAFFMLYTFIIRLSIENAKSERLLLNVLPKEVAAILKDNQRTIAEHFDWATILFADMVGFTPLASALTPVQTVDLLNEVFSAFDVLAEKYGIEKIRTIGDSYMAAAGVPQPRVDHASAVARLALEFRDWVDHSRRDGRDLSFRIGINSGPVVAGVIGRKKFQYDLWGDAVNMASRMESQGAAGKIQITEATYELIKDDFVCEKRGVIAIKGKGEMTTWYLLADRQKNEEPAAPIPS